MNLEEMLSCGKGELQLPFLYHSQFLFLISLLVESTKATKITLENEWDVPRGVLLPGRLSRYYTRSEKVARPLVSWRRPCVLARNLGGSRTFVDGI